MRTEWKVVIGIAVALHVLLVWCMCRVSARSERAARERRRRFRQSLLNRRSP